jgi:hypothetical protein
MCGKESNRREHIIKKSDIIRVYGNGPYKGENALVHVKNGNMMVVQGPDSKKVKYKSSLCHECNTTFTKPFDIAYDNFISFIYENEQEILRKRFVNFSDVYGKDFEEGQRNLYKYFAKSFGCRLYDAGSSVPQDISSSLQKKSFITGLRINFSVNEDILILPNEIRDGFIGKGDLLVWLDKTDKSEINGYTWNEHVSWLFISYWYLITPDGGLGSTWIADSQFIYLGCQHPLNDKQREDLKRKVQK